jgi:hypothetical protein
MIESDTYLEDRGTKENLLGAFSAIDVDVADELDKERVDTHFRRFMLRATALTFYHGLETPRDFLRELSSTEEAFDVANSFLEAGVLPDKADSEILDRRELQQEFVHFSRIVDVPSQQDREGVNHLHTKRLRKSTDLPDTLKVTTELMTVTRSRHIQRGKNLPLPRRRAPGVSTKTIANSIEVQYPDHDADYVLLVRGNSRFRRKVTFFHRNLLPYLTPEEALLALYTYLAEGELNTDGSISLLSRTPDGSVRQTNWSRPAGSPDSDPIAWCDTTLPTIKPASEPSELDFTTVADQIDIEWTVNESDNVWEIKMWDENESVELSLEVPANEQPDIDELSQEAIKQVEAESLSSVRSIECGHLHLDREIDNDQRAGMRIGIDVFHRLQELGHDVSLRPMVDDDHVIVQLSPEEYRNFFESYLIEGDSFELIPESSPITRAIVVALFDRLKDQGLADELDYRGGNVYLDVSEQTTIELFEDFEGRCDNGCAFFEIGLLIYRTAPEKFTEYFNNRFETDSLHDQIADILSKDLSHDERRSEIEELYAQFEPVTSPQDPDEEFTALVEEVLAEAQGDQPVHMNILEDYYELQQHKVRELLARLDVPITLKSLHYNTANGRINFEG